MSYLEEIYRRAEHQFTSKSEMIAWLDSFERPDRGATPYTKDAVQVRNDITQSEFLQEQTEKIDQTDWTTADDLRDLRKDADDLELTKIVSETVNIPVIASGGAGTLHHIYQVLVKGKADAVLAASIFHYGEYSIKETKKYLKERGIVVRM